MPGRLLNMSSESSPLAEAAKSNRRASSRVRKPTQHFASAPISRGKRKREPGAGGDTDVSNEDVSDEETVSEEESDEEEAPTHARKSQKSGAGAGRKPAAKKPRVNGISLPIRGSRAPAKKRAPSKAKAHVAADAEAAGGIYAEVFAHRKQAAEVISGWLEDFSKHESRALADVINFVLKCAGCDGKVTEVDIEDVDGVTGRLTDLQDEHQATEPTEYPFIAKGKNSISFKQNVSNFIETFVKAIAANQLLYNNKELMENVQVWFSTMTSATNRGFRHTSTVVSLSVITALCEVAKELAEKAANSKRQAETERKKSRVNKERVKQIEKRAKEANTHLEYVEALLKDWFDVVFIHRYRDVDPLIRRDCISALGDWITTVPEIFFDGNHLRYLGWVLSDASPAARAENLKQLQRLYNDSDKLGGLKTFTERFRSRMVEIGTSDADVNVRISGIKLLDLLRENGLLEPSDIDAVGRLIFHDDARIRKAVATFFSENVSDLFNSKVEDIGGSEGLDETLPRPGEGNFEAPRLEWVKFKSLAEMLQSYDTDEELTDEFERNKNDGSLVLHAGGVESRYTLAVSVLYDEMKEMKEWQALAGYLLFDHSSGRANGASDVLTQLKHECVLSDKEETILLEVLQGIVRRTLNDLVEKIAGSKTKLTKRQKEDLQEEQEEAVRNLTDLLPMLLKKFGDVPGTAAAVLRLEAVLALPSLQSINQDSVAAAGLLDDVKKQFMSHGTDEVLVPASAAILHAQSYGDLDDTTSEKLAGLWEDVVSNLAELVNLATITVRGASLRGELLALSNNLLRIVRLSTVSNCVQPLEDTGVPATNKKNKRSYSGAIDFILDLIQRARPATDPAPDGEDAALEDEIAARAAEAALFYFRWKIMAIINTITAATNADVPDDTLRSLAERHTTYVENLASVLESRKANEAVLLPIASCLLDLYTSAAVLRTVKARPGVNDDYTVLIMDFDPIQEKAVMKVFNATEKEFAKLSGKKLESTATDADPIDDEDVNAAPIDDEDEPVSEPESEGEAPVKDSNNAHHDEQLKKPLIAEQRLCQLTSKLIYAIAAGVIDDRATRKRLERNRTRLGPNFKEVVAYLDLDKKQQQQPKTKAKTVAAAGKAGKVANGSAKRPSVAPKSNAIVAEDDELEDEIEVEVEREEEEDEQMVDGDGVTAGAEEHEESVLGD